MASGPLNTATSGVREPYRRVGLTELRILTLDIETKPITAHVWGLWDQNVGLNQIVDAGGILCVGLKWVGQPVELYSEWTHSKEGMLAIVHAALLESDVVIGYNSERFDLAKLNGQFLMNGFPPVPPPTSIDLLKTVKKMGLVSGKLAYVGPALGIGSKMKHEGFDLWAKVMAGDPVAQRKMERYCKQDVVITEKLYHKLRPFIRNHPHLGDLSTDCPACESHHIQKRGVRRTRSFLIQRNQCQSCGHWFESTRSKVK